MNKFSESIVDFTTFLLKCRFYILSLLLLGLMVSQTLNGQWVGDFWEHSAVVRELATHPFSPKHPQLLLDAPHAFYSPYTWIVACISRLTFMSPVTALAVFGIINLMTFLFGLRLFIRMLMPERAETVAFYTLLFTLVLWGEGAWGYSGFFHARVLGYVLPYPSTFAMAWAFIGLSTYHRAVRRESLAGLIAAIVIAVAVLLTHPLTFLFFAVGLIALTFSQRRYYVQLIGLFVLVGVGAVAWFYYPFLKLILSESQVYHSSNRVMYDNFISRILPALIGIPLLLLRFRSNWRDPLGIMFLSLCFIFVFGEVFDKWSYGRIISPIVLILHIAMAAGMAWIESKLKWRQAQFAFSCLIVLFIIYRSHETFVRPAIELATPGRPNSYSQYQFLSDYTDQYDVVLSDMASSWVIPTFGGKVIAARHPLAFVPDHDTRIEDVNRFFAQATGAQARFEMIQKYRVDFLLLNKGYVTEWNKLGDSFQSVGRVVFDNDRFRLIALE